jgi:hypothetical protein
MKSKAEQLIDKLLGERAVVEATFTPGGPDDMYAWDEIPTWKSKSGSYDFAFWKDTGRGANFQVTNSKGDNYEYKGSITDAQARSIVNTWKPGQESDNSKWTLY